MSVAGGSPWFVAFEGLLTLAVCVFIYRVGLPFLSRRSNTCWRCFRELAYCSCRAKRERRR